MMMNLFNNIIHNNTHTIIISQFPREFVRKCGGLKCNSIYVMNLVCPRNCMAKRSGSVTGTCQLYCLAQTLVFEAIYIVCAGAIN